MNGNGQRFSLGQEDPETEAPSVSRRFAGPSLLQILWQRRAIIAGTLVAALSAALLYLTQATSIYTSTSRLYVEKKGPKIISEARGVMTESKNYLYTQGELLRSTPILADALGKPAMNSLRTFDGVDNRIGFLKGKLHTSVGRRDDIISVSFNSPDPEEAAQIANEIVDSYITYHATKKRSTAAEVLKILRKEKATRDAEWADKLQAMRRFKQEHKTLTFDQGKGNIVIERLAKLSESLTNAQLGTIADKIAYETSLTVSKDPASFRQWIETERGGQRYRREREQTELNRLSARLAQLRHQMAPQAPAILTLEARISEIERQLADQDGEVAGVYVDVMHQGWLTALSAEDEIRKLLQGQKELAETLSAEDAEYAILEADLRRSEQINDILDSRIKELNITEDTGALNLTILEVAKASTTPTEPRKSRIMAIALMLGLMLGGGLALLRDMTDQRLRSVDQITAVLGTPLLGAVPHMTEGVSDAERGQHVHHEAQSNIAEAYRTIRTAVYFGITDDKSKTLLVTSPASAEGKSTLVSNLATSMAQAGQRTLVLDADFRKPSQHKIFEVSAEAGLANVLVAKSELDDVIARTAVEGLDILPCGPIPPNPSEMLNSQIFADTLAKLGERYDHIVIDSPPVIPVTDARILSAICDVTLLVLRAERSTRRAAEQTMEGLLSVGGQVLGVIVNDVPRRRGRYGYYGYGYYGYGYGGYGQRKTTEQEVQEVG